MYKKDNTLDKKDMRYPDKPWFTKKEYINAVNSIEDILKNYNMKRGN